MMDNSVRVRGMERARSCGRVGIYITESGSEGNSRALALSGVQSVAYRDMSDTAMERMKGSKYTEGNS